jgi:AcrR family transcriptional regulator
MPPQTQTSSPDDNGRKIEILRAAALLFHKKGFDATSMNDIAKAVNLTKPGLYYYVQSKEDLLFAIMEHAMNQLQEAVITPAKKQSSPDECLASIIENHARVVMEDRVITILTDEMAGLSPEHYELLIQRKQDYLDLLRSTLEELMAAGRVRPLNPTVMAFSIFGILLWLPRWFQPDGQLSREEVVEQVKEFIYSGICQTVTAPNSDPEKYA